MDLISHSCNRDITLFSKCITLETSGIRGLKLNFLFQGKFNVCFAFNFFENILYSTQQSLCRDELTPAICFAKFARFLA
jgi:hypothetical protein